MTPEERQMLTDLANKIAQTPAPPIDHEAEEFIRTRIGSRPDALYLMTQTVLIQNMALEQAKQQIQQMQAQGGGSHGSFLGNQAGWSRPAGAGQPQQAYAPASAPSPQTPSAAAAPAGGGGGSTFLRGAAQTAAGVAAGALAFEGIRSLFSGFGGPHYGSGFMGGEGMGGYGAPVEETIVNNYYDSPDRGEDVSSADNFQDNSGQDFDTVSDDLGDDFSDTGSDDYLA